MSSLDQTSARRIAAHAIAELGERWGTSLEIIERPLSQGAYGWVFGFQSSDRRPLAGNTPILVEQPGGKVHMLGTTLAIDDYIAAFGKFGDPHMTPGPRVELKADMGAGDPALAIRHLRDATGLGLTDCRALLARADRGEPCEAVCTDAGAAAALATSMNALGYTARQRGTKPLSISVESLSRAIADGATDTVRDLLDAGLSPNSAMNDQKWRPLHLAAEHQRADIAALLLEAGADPNTPDQTGFTPLHLAVDSEADAARQTGCRPTPGVSRILLEKGADPNRPDKTGASPLDLAESYDYRAFLALVIN